MCRLLSLLILAGFLPLIENSALRGQAAKEKIDPKKKTNLLVPEPLELKAGNPLSAMMIVSQPPPVKGAISWAVEPKRHRGNVSAIAASPDGSLAATSGGDGQVRLWDVASGKLLRILAGHNAGTGGIAFSPDGSTLASTSGDATARIWNPKTGMTLRVLKKHKGGTSRVAWSPDGEALVVAGGSSGFATFWNPAQNKQLRTVEHGKGVTSVAWSPDGKTVACTTPDGVALWNAADGTSAGKIEPPSPYSYAVSWSPDSVMLAVGGQKSITVWKFVGHEMIRELAGACVSVAWSPDGQQLASSTGIAVSIWNATTWNRDRTIPFAAVSLDWDKKSTRLFAGSTQDVLIIDPKGEPVGETSAKTINAAAGGTLIWTPGRPILSGIATPALQSWDPLTGRPLPSFAGNTGRVDVVQWSRDGKLLASGSVDKTARVWDAKSGKLLHTHDEHADWVTSVDWSPDGRLATACRDKIVRVFPAGGDDPPKELKGHTHAVRCVAWSRDGSVLASGGDDGFVILWDLAAAGPAKKLPIDKEKDVIEVAFSLDGRLLAAACADANIRIFSIPSGKLLTTLESRAAIASFYRLAWSNDAQQLLTASFGYGSQLWSVKTSTLLRGFSIQQQVQMIAWAADNKTAVASCLDRCIRFCDPVTGQIRATMLRDANQIAVVSPEGHYRAAADLESELVYIVQTDKSQDTYEPKAFVAKFGWRNNPASVKP